MADTPMFDVPTFEFWSVIGERDLRDADDVTAALGYVGGRLDEAPAESLTAFAKRLRKQLYLLDKWEFASIPVVLAGWPPLPQTSDHFLYSRCACVLAGKSQYDRVLTSGQGFERFTVVAVQSAESLLYLADERYEAKTGHRMPLTSDYPIESAFFG